MPVTKLIAVSRAGKKLYRRETTGWALFDPQPAWDPTYSAGTICLGLPNRSIIVWRGSVTDPWCHYDAGSNSWSYKPTAAFSASYGDGLRGFVYDDDHVFVCQTGVIERFSASTGLWTALTNIPSSGANIAATGPQALWSGGAHTVLSYSGDGGTTWSNRWSEMEAASGIPTDGWRYVVDMWAVGNVLYALLNCEYDAKLRLVRYDGTSWSVVGGTGLGSGYSQGNGVWGTGDNDLWVMKCDLNDGSKDKILHWNGASWSTSYNGSYVGVAITNRPIMGDGGSIVFTAWTRGSGMRLETTNGGTSWASPTWPDSNYPSSVGIHLLLDEIGPTVGDQFPASGTTGVSRGTPVSFTITDAGSGVSTAATTVTVNGTTVWTGDAPANGWTGSRSVNGSTHTYTLRPPSLLSPLTSYTVAVHAEDMDSNATNTSWSFTTTNILLFSSIGWAVEKQTIAADGGLTGPVFVSATSTDPNTVRLVFDRRLMLEYRQAGVYRAQTLDLTSFRIAKIVGGAPLEVVRTIWINETTIDLATANQEAATYRVTCVANGVMDFWGNLITEQTADFLGQQKVDYTTPADLHVFTSGYAGMQEDLTNDFYPDLVPPYIDDQYPAAAPPWVPNPPSTNVQVDIHDDDDGVKLSSVRVYIEGALAYRGDTDAFVAPYNGPSSARITQPLGYRITIDPTSPFASYQVVDVRVYAEDLAVITNVLDTLYQFRIADTSVPHLDNVVPAGGDTDIARNTNITLEIHDDDSAIDTASVVLTVAGVIAWQSETAQPGFAVTVTAVPTGWRYVINPDTDFTSWQTVTVEVYATDTEIPPNVLDTSYQFRTLDVDAPYIDNEDPAPGQLNVHPFTNIQMDVLDAGSGVKANSVKLYVNGTIAYQNQVQQPGFVVAQTPIGGGYRYLINPDDPLPVLTNTIRVVADDLATVPNHLDTNYTFQVSDATEPVIEDEFPLGENVPPSTHISFTCWDNILVVKASIQVTVGTEVAIQNGVFQVGWNGPASSIVANLFNGWDVVVDKETDIPYGSEVTVRVSIADLTGVPVTSTWTFLVNVDPTCFTGPINDFESSLLVPYDHAASTLYYTEQLRQYLLAVVQARPDPIKAIRHVYLRANLGELGALLRNLAPTPTTAEKTAKLCYKRTAIQIDAALRRKPGLLNAVLAELTALGLPKEHRELLWSYLRTDQPNDLVPLACVMVCLAKILEQNALS